MYLIQISYIFNTSIVYSFNCIMIQLNDTIKLIYINYEQIYIKYKLINF